MRLRELSLFTHRNGQEILILYCITYTYNTKTIVDGPQKILLCGPFSFRVPEESVAITRMMIDKGLAWTEAERRLPNKFSEQRLRKGRPRPLLAN